MEDWKKKNISDYIDLINGYAFKSKNFLIKQKDNTFPVIKIKNVANGDVNLNDVVYHKLDSKLEKYILQKGDVLIAMTGNHPSAKTQVVGGVSKYKLEGKGLLNQRVGKFIIKKNSDIDFIYYLYKSKAVNYKLANKSSGSASQANISKKAILNLKILLPPLPEQRAITSVLSSLDDKIDLLHRQNQTLEAMAETLFRQWFVEEAEKDWEEMPLSSIAEYLNGIPCQKFPPKNEYERLPVLKIKELRNGISKDSDWCTSDVEKKYIIQNGDVIFSWSASLIVKIWDGETCILNQHLFKVTSDKYPKWYYYLWTKFHLNEFIGIAKAHATTMGHIRRSDLDNAIVLIPSKTELIKMTKTMNPIITKTIENNKQIRTLTQLRDTLLPKLMSGEIRIKETEVITD